MITIKCAKCHKKLIKYQKLGKGRVLRCYKERIKETYFINDKNIIKCECGNIIGTDEEKLIRMKQGSFIFSGTIVKK